MNSSKQGTTHLVAVEGTQINYREEAELQLQKDNNVTLYLHCCRCIKKGWLIFRR